MRGATGTGKTVTLQTIAQKLSSIGVPVFMADVKGDLTGITQAGTVGAKLAAILKERGIEPSPSVACPATLWDVFATDTKASGHPVRATVSDMGPLLLSRMLALNEIQQGVLQLVFKIADDNGMLLLDLKDLRAMLQYVGDNGSQFTDRFTSKNREPSGRHKFDVRCKALSIEHRLCPPRHPQTNGMVERFNGRLSELVSQTRFASAAELEATLDNYVKTYNHRIPQRALNHLSPVQALKKWQAEKPELFVKRV